MNSTAKNIRTVVQQYTDGWLSADRQMILSTLTPDCEIIESHGPHYIGTRSISSWIDTWHNAGGRVVTWEITSFSSFEDAACYEWKFCCIWEGTKDSFSGCTIVTMKDGLISSLREYRMTHAQYRVEPT
jgi:hypothetical protein